MSFLVELRAVREVAEADASSGAGGRRPRPASRFRHPSAPGQSAGLAAARTDPAHPAWPGSRRSWLSDRATLTRAGGRPAATRPGSARPPDPAWRPGCRSRRHRHLGVLGASARSWLRSFSSPGVRALQLVRAQLDHSAGRSAGSRRPGRRAALAGSASCSVKRVCRPGFGPPARAAWHSGPGATVRSADMSSARSSYRVSPRKAAPTRCWSRRSRGYPTRKWGVRRPLGGQLHRGARRCAGDFTGISDASRPVRAERGQ